LIARLIHRKAQFAHGFDLRRVDLTEAILFITRGGARRFRRWGYAQEIEQRFDARLRIQAQGIEDQRQKTPGSNPGPGKSRG
jgi:hypothetical protein